MRARGDRLLGWARMLDDGGEAPFASRPRPRRRWRHGRTRFSVTEIETLRRDPYAVYARRILDLAPLEPLLRDPGAAERGTLFHDILQRFTEAGIDAAGPEAEEQLLGIGRQCFAELALPADVEAVWWPRFEALAEDIVRWEREDREGVTSRRSEELRRGYAGRRNGRHAVGLRRPHRSSPGRHGRHSRLQDRLVALEGAGAHAAGAAARAGGGAAEARRVQGSWPASAGSSLPSCGSRRMARSRSNRSSNTIATSNRRIELAEEAWRRLEQLLRHYNDPANGYLSRALPFREGETDGDYDHLARVLEWSAGSEDSIDSEGEE